MCSIKGAITRAAHAVYALGYRDIDAHLQWEDHISGQEWLNDKLALVRGFDLRVRAGIRVSMPLRIRCDANEQPCRSNHAVLTLSSRCPTATQRAQLHRLLTQADAYNRYRPMSPGVSELATGCLDVHRKQMVINDEPLLVGSANLNNRSSRSIPKAILLSMQTPIRAFRARWHQCSTRCSPSTSGVRRRRHAGNQ